MSNEFKDLLFKLDISFILIGGYFFCKYFFNRINKVFSSKIEKILYIANVYLFACLNLFIFEVGIFILNKNIVFLINFVYAIISILFLILRLKFNKKD